MSQEHMQNNDSRQKNPGGMINIPKVSEVLVQSQKVQDKVRVSHGANEQYFDGISGKSVEQVRKSLREVFNIPQDAEAVVDGKVVANDFVLEAGQYLEFYKPAGTKGI